MSFDAERFLMDHNIPWTSTGKHSRPGWAQIVCPFCSGNPGWHGGFHIEAGYYNCWRCGFKWLPKVASALLKISVPKAKDVIKPYMSPDAARDLVERKFADTIHFPPNTGPMNARQKEYLAGRKFDPDRLEQEWDLKGVGQIGEYKGRILAPIRLHSQLISYQTRDTTGTHPAKYMACPRDDEVFPHKHSLYGIDECSGKAVVIVEGISDVWRLGYGSVGLSGIDYTAQQRLMIARTFKRAFIFLDDEDQAQERSLKLSMELESHGIECENIVNKGGDPADLKENEAKDLMTELL